MVGLSAPSRKRWQLQAICLSGFGFVAQLFPSRVLNKYYSRIFFVVIIVMITAKYFLSQKSSGCSSVFKKKHDCPTRVMNIMWWVVHKHSDQFPINMVSLRLLHQMMLHKVSKATGSIPNDLPLGLRTWCLPRLWMRRKRWQQLHLS